MSPTGATGIRLLTDAKGRAVIAYAQTDEAERAGIAPGQRIVAVDGKRVDQRTEVLEHLRGDVGTIVRVETISRDGRRAEHLLTRDPDHRREAYQRAHITHGTVFAASIFGVFIGAGFLPLTCAALLLVRRPGDRFAPWASLGLVFFALGYGPAVFWYGGDEGISLFFVLLNSLATASLLITLVLFPDGKFTTRSIKIVSLIVVAIVTTWPEQSGTSGNIVLSAGLVVCVIIIADRMRRFADNQETQQIRWVLFGFAAATLSLILYTIANTFSTSAGSVEVEVLAVLAAHLFAFTLAGLLVAGITVGLLRYRLYDADATISRSV
ncbi:MAG: hypothetical protein EOO77_47360, partial [Oxalobacteraceae bacterium]